MINKREFLFVNEILYALKKDFIKNGELAVYIDRSGSTKEDALLHAILMICDVFRYFETINVYLHTVQIDAQEKFDTNDILSGTIGHYMAKTFVEPGGTRHDCVIKNICKEKQKYVILISDCESDIVSPDFSFEGTEDSKILIIQIGRHDFELTNDNITIYRIG